MLEIRADRRNNRLYLVASGTLNAEELRDSPRLVREASKELRRGYDVISDISHLDLLTDDLVEHVRALMEELRKHGRRIVRVVGRSSQVTVQLTRIARDVGYDAYLAFSIEEAERLLDDGIELP